LPKRTPNRWVAVAIFGGLFVALFAIVGVATGVGHPSVPSDAVAVVEDVADGTISKADFDAALTQAAAREGLPKAPKPSDQQYSSLKTGAMSSVLLSRWIVGEAEERGITISDSEVASKVKEVAQQQFGGRKQFLEGIKQLGFTPQQAREEIKRSLITERLEKTVVPTEPAVDQSEINDYYQGNQAQFSQPETRDVREIVNSDQAKVEQAKALLEEDDSPKSWKRVAAKYSTDKATKDNGGLRQGVAEGQDEAAVEEQIFSAEEGALVGPIEGEKSYYLIQVDKISPATTTPLSKVAAQIRQQLAAGVQQQVAADFQTDFIDKWTERTFCAKGYVIDRCANYVPKTSKITCENPEEGCGAFVYSIAPVAPGEATVFIGQQPQTLQQGPVPAGGSEAQQPGVIGPGGAPQLPPGAAPQTAP
jgi:parvulin-like peptidyl-prolyl isomerase